MTILIIDDDPEVIEVVSLASEMKWPDAVIVSALNGESGLQMVGSESPDVVVLDLILPDMDGFDVCRETRRFSDVPVLMLTVRNKEVDIVKGLKVGADDYVTKPFRPLELVARMQSVIRRANVAPISDNEEPFRCGSLFVDFVRRQVAGEVLHGPRLIFLS